MSKMRIIALVLLVLFLHANVLGQGDSTLLARIESSILKEEPRWKLVRKTSTRTEQYFGFYWKSGKSSVYVLVAFYGSPKEASNGLKNLPDFLEDGGLRMVVLPSTIPNLGDENFVWEDCCDKRFTGVDFRKGKVVVHVNAPSIEIAQRFASHVAKTLDINP